MVAFILPANSATGGYEIDNSLRFNKGDSPKLNFTQGTPTSRRTWTYSTWVKRGNLKDQSESILSWGDEDFFDIRFQDGTPDDGLLVFISDGDSKNVATTRLFRDPAAWYHIIVASDTTDGTAGDRTRIYVNGVEETSFATEAQPDQNYDYRGLVSGDTICIGNRYTGSHYLDGYLADTHFIDGQQLTPSSFGETNDNGVWIPIEYSGTYGTNGFKLEYKQSGTGTNASGMGADTSGNDNHFAVTNLTATDVTTDTPTNNFATMNPLDVGSDLRDNGSFAEGNLEVINGATSGQANQQRVRGTIAVTKGKWYFEMKQIANSASIGVLATEAAHGGTSANSMLVEYNDGGEIRFFNGSGRTTKSTGIDGFDDDDIVGCALDMDNRRAYFHKNGTYQGDPTPDPAGSPSGAGQFGGIQTGFTMAPCMFDNSSGSAGKGSFNFGNAPFAISSGNADANGYGNFEYAPPSGYFALCTKNLAEYGG